LAGDIGQVESTSQRVASLRTILREFLVALDNGDEVVAQLLERCTVGPHDGPLVMLIPLTRLPRRDSGDRVCPTQRGSTPPRAMA
jgi:hypothetical protein